MTVPDLTGEIPVAHIARAPRGDVMQVRRPVVPRPVRATEHVGLIAPRRHSRGFYVTRLAVRSVVWALLGGATAAGIWASIWAVYAVWVTR